MSRRTRRICGAGILGAGLIAAAIGLVPALLQGFDSRPAAPADKLIVHEWGTFTSFAGSDGVNLEFRPLVANDLPPFVFGSNPWPGSLPAYLSKREYIALQRMETPVTYFYTDRPRVVNVRVDFPQGMLTEWFPAVRQAEPGKQKADRTIAGRAFLDWGPVRLTPQEEFAQVRVRNTKGQIVPAFLPSVSDHDHYGRARETDSAIVETVDSQRGSYFEKFLFYRGLGSFKLPIKLSALGHDRFEVANAAADPSGALLLVRIERDSVRFIRLDPIAARSAVETVLPAHETTIDALAAATVRVLTAAGLYDKEAWAMVNTWRDSWFGEQGTRLLYLVPGQLTDELLPLTIEPAPEEQVRVLVGRLETLTPEDCRRLVQAVAGDGRGAEPSAESIKFEIATLGRFAEPALQFVIGQTSDPQVRARLEKLLSQIRGVK